MCKRRSWTESQEFHVSSGVDENGEPSFEAIKKIKFKRTRIDDTVLGGYIAEFQIIGEVKPRLITYMEALRSAITAGEGGVAKHEYLKAVIVLERDIPQEIQEHTKAALRAEALWSGATIESQPNAALQAEELDSGKSTNSRPVHYITATLLADAAIIMQAAMHTIHPLICKRPTNGSAAEAASLPALVAA